MAVEIQPESLEDLQEKTLLNCHEVLKKKLDVKEIYPQMNERNLLTAEDRHVLLDTSRSTETKVIHIIEILPRKQGWWAKFIASLRESTSGTAHEYLASTLTNQLKRKMYESGQQTLGHRGRVYNNSANYDVPSGISLDMYDFMPVVLPPTAGYSELSNKEIPDIAKLRPDLADILNPIVRLKEELDTIKYDHNIMKNQVGLLQAFDELIEKTKSFSDALSDLLELYIDKFKTKKRQNYSQLTVVERKVIQIIEDITECTEDIDIDKEREVWNQCVIKMEKNHDHIIKVLCTQDTSKMAAVQRTWKLDGEEAKAAEAWIAVRKQVVVLGNSSLDKLDELRSEDGALITSIYDTVSRRVKAGEHCLEAWIKWVNERIKLGSTN